MGPLERLKFHTNFRIISCVLVLYLSGSNFVFAQEEKSAEPIPKFVGYFAIYHPIAGYNAPTNFKDGYVVGFPIGFVIFKTPRVGYSLELFPFIQADSEGSKVNKIVFHPGVVFRLNHGFAFTGRVAFESTGRYGLTQVLTKSIVKTRSGSLGISAVVAERFGNEMDTSISYGIGIGLTF